MLLTLRERKLNFFRVLKIHPNMKPVEIEVTLKITPIISTILNQGFFYSKYNENIMLYGISYP